MKIFKISLPAAFIAVAAFTFQACHTKKLITKPTPVVSQPAPAPAPKPAPAPVQSAPVPAPKPNLNFTNVQFDYNSAVLRTDAIQYLDYVASQMKLVTGKQFTLNGYASAEGTAAHNLALSADRANVVKQYLVNGGVNGAILSTAGFGTRHPVASNKTEDGREKNRRVEIKAAQ